MLAIRTGRRPIRSLSRPQSGAASIDICEKIPSRSVTSCGEAPKRSA
jgi:hypothetical protein